MRRRSNLVSSLKFTLFLWLLSLQQQGIASNHHQQQDTDDIVNVTLSSRQDPVVIKPEFTGTNILYWIDVKNDWTSGLVPGQLSQLGIKTLRYPGGEVGDNYDWESNRIERKDQFPREAKTEDERNQRLDYRQFLSFAQQAGIKNIFFVVNLEGACFQPGDIHKNVEKYAESAVRWVAAVKKDGYHVAYWEIGNESYLRSACPFSAHEYAAALKVFYAKMKAADPSIKIGAVGPAALHGDDALGYADAIGTEATGKIHQAIQNGNFNLCERENREKCKHLLATQDSGSGVPQGWWETVVSEAGESFDFAVIHRYKLAGIKKSSKSQPESLNEKLRELKNFIEAKKGSHIELALTEWNTSLGTHSRHGNTLSETRHSIEMVKLIGEYLEGGVDYALYWPFRNPSVPFSLVGDTGFSMSAKVIQAFNAVKKSSLCDAQYGGNVDDIYLLCTENDGSTGLLVINQATKDRRVFIHTRRPIQSILKIQSISGDQSGSAAPVSYTLKPEGVIITVPSEAVITVDAPYRDGQLDSGVSGY
jgi:hypothetical protein